MTPGALPRRAQELGISALALTDHDTTAGLPEFMAACAEIGFRGIPGVELSVSEDNMQCHLVGLFLNPSHPELTKKLQQIVDWRNERNEKILDALRTFGMELTLEEVQACSKDGIVIGRPHFAKALVKRGYCASEEGAFRKYLRRGCPAYFPRKAFGFHEAVELLHRSGALAIWAHPMTSANMSNVAFERRLSAMKVLGLNGVEAYYPVHTANNTRHIIRIAQEKHLLVSGGTDYHGGGSHQGIELGVGYGNGFCVPDELLEKLDAARTAPWVFFDRDDTLIYDVPYMTDPAPMELTPGASAALRCLSYAGYRTGMISNQSGIGRGRITPEQFMRVQMRLAELLSEGGAGLDAVYYCPHTPEAGCRCRKPDTGMFEQACAEHKVNVAQSWMVGDLPSDIQAGRSFGLRTIQVRLPGRDKPDAGADFTVSSLSEAVDIILGK